MLPWLIVVRLVVNTALRMGYSFLPAFARGAGISNGSMGLVLAIRDLSGLAAPFAGRIADRHGTGRLLAAGAVGGTVGLLIAATSPVGLVIGFLVVGFGSITLHVGSGAWIGHAVAYERRGRAVGLVELSWGGAGLLGIPLIGVLIDQLGWRAAPTALALIALPVSFVLVREHSSMSVDSASTSTKARLSRTAIGGLASYALVAMSAQFVFLGHGLWLEDTYQLSATSIGLVVFAAAVMEVVATLATARITDALGKRTSMLIGTSIMVVSMLLFAVAPAAPLPVAVPLLAATFLGFEFAIVSALPLLSELDPDARATMFARATALSTVGRAAVSLFAVGVYERFGFGTLMSIAASAGVAALVSLFFVDEPAVDVG